MEFSLRWLPTNVCMRWKTNFLFSSTLSARRPPVDQKVIYQRMFGFWSIAQMSLFFTVVGLFNAFLMWPMALLLYFLGVEIIVCK